MNKSMSSCNNEEYMTWLEKFDVIKAKGTIPEIIAFFNFDILPTWWKK